MKDNDFFNPIEGEENYLHQETMDLSRNIDAIQVQGIQERDERNKPRQQLQGVVDTLQADASARYEAKRKTLLREIHFHRAQRSAAVDAAGPIFEQILVVYRDGQTTERDCYKEKPLGELEAARQLGLFVPFKGHRILLAVAAALGMLHMAFTIAFTEKLFGVFDAFQRGFNWGKQWQATCTGILLSVLIAVAMHIAWGTMARTVVTNGGRKPNSFWLLLLLTAVLALGFITLDSMVLLSLNPTFAILGQATLSVGHALLIATVMGGLYVGLTSLEGFLIHYGLVASIAIRDHIEKDLDGRIRALPPEEQEKIRACIGQLSKIERHQREGDRAEDELATLEQWYAQKTRDLQSGRPSFEVGLDAKVRAKSEVLEIRKKARDLNRDAMKRGRALHSDTDAAEGGAA